MWTMINVGEKYSDNGDDNDDHDCDDSSWLR
jgi:hypothetical protein